MNDKILYPDVVVKRPQSDSPPEIIGAVRKALFEQEGWVASMEFVRFVNDAPDYEAVLKCCRKYVTIEEPSERT